jgi:AraC family transcriptional activator of tynA and feaB
MEKVFSTADVHPRDRFDYWHSVACANLAGSESRPENRLGFEAEIEVGDLAEIGLVLFRNAPMRAAREARHIAQVRNDHLFFCRQVSGTLSVEQDGNAATLGASDMLLLDPLLPHTATFSMGSKTFVLKLPRRALEARIGKTRAFVSHAIQHHFASSFLGMLPDHAAAMTPSTQQMIQDQALDVVAMSLMQTMVGAKRNTSSGRALSILKLRAVIESRLSDPALDAATVAAVAGISVRYANTLLREDDTSIMRLIQARRLARCRKALEDPLQNRRTLSEIAYGWGFSDMTHFGRIFKAAYGMLPSDCRRTAQQI